MKSGTVTVSVGIPVYNGEHYIRKAVESVLSQTYTDFELIVTDDGSTDNTLQILNSIKDPRLKVVSDGKNRGIAYRLNQQIDMAHGEFFARMDADDMMMPHRLERQIKVLRDDVAVDVVGSEAVIIGEHDELLGKRCVNPDIFRTANDYFKSARFIHPTVTGRLSWFRKWRYSDKMSGNEDLDLWIRSRKDSKFYDIHEPLMFYRDPYRFRLKTYFFRQRRFWKCAWKLRNYMNSPLFMFYCICRGIAVTSLAFYLTLLGREEGMISRRNIPLSMEEVEKYSEMISKKTNNI